MSAQDTPIQHTSFPDLMSFYSDFLASLLNDLPSIRRVPLRYLPPGLSTRCANYMTDARFFLRTLKDLSNMQVLVPLPTRDPRDERLPSRRVTTYSPPAPFPAKTHLSGDFTPSPPPPISHPVPQRYSIVTAQTHLFRRRMPLRQSGPPLHRASRRTPPPPRTPSAERNRARTPSPCGEPPITHLSRPSRAAQRSSANPKVKMTPCALCNRPDGHAEHCCTSAATVSETATPEKPLSRRQRQRAARRAARAKQTHREPSPVPTSGRLCYACCYEHKILDN